MSRFFIVLSKNKIANSLARKYGLKFGAKKFVAGQNIDEAIKTADKLKEYGIDSLFNYLGEFSDDKESCLKTTEELIQVIKVLKIKSDNRYLSVKASSIGLQIDEEFCKTNLRKILSAAKEADTFVRIEMEDYSFCDKTLRVYKDLRQEYDNVGTVLQSYLYRTNDDLKELESYHPNLRLVKGAYNESSNVAFPDKKDVDQKYKELIKTQLLRGDFASIATHDSEAIDFAKNIIEENNIPKENFEFQMLLGIRPDLEKQLSEEGYNIRVYLPFGSEWFGYFMRRLGERPENVSFVIKNTFKRKVS